MKPSFFGQKIISFFLLISILSWTFMPFIQPKNVDAALNVKSLLPGVSKGLVSAAATCIAGVGGSLALGKASAKAESLTATVPVADGSATAGTVTTAGKEYCLDAVGTEIAKAVLRKFTESTVNWINSGFNGDPLYVRDPGSFFKSIAQEQIGGLVLSVEGSGAPFARSLAQTLILSQLDDFRASMKYNIDSYLGKQRADDYLVDFSVGGWDAWILQTQYPQNNPIGASIQLGNEVSRKLAGTEKSVAENAQNEINQGLGFLGLKECADPIDFEKAPEGGFRPPTILDPFEGMTAQEIAELTPAERAQIENDAQTAYTDALVREREEYESKHNCKRWETVTPGNAIAEQLNLSLGTSKRQAELADELNESVAVVFDALFNQLINTGLNSLTTTTTSPSGSTNNFGGYGSNSSVSTTGGGNGSWINQTQPSIYSIWTDLPEIITDQNNYLTVMGQKKALLQNQLIPKIYELDFCVPGPRPDWEASADKIVNDKITQLSNGYNSARIRDLFFYSFYLPITDSADVVKDAGQGIGLLTSVYDQVKELVKIKWFSQAALLTLPTINTINQNEYPKIAQYKTQIEVIDQEILEVRSVISRVSYIQTQLQGFPNPTTGGVLTPAQQDTADQQQRVLDQIANLVATKESITAVENEILGLTSEISYIGDSTKGLIKQCINEVNAITVPTYKKRLQYPTDLVPLSVQNTYNPGPATDFYDGTTTLGLTSISRLAGPTYIHSGTGPDSVSYGSGGSCVPTGSYVHVTDIINLSFCATTAGFEKWIMLY